MAVEKPETDGFLAVIEKKIDALVALRDTYKQAMAIGALGPLGDLDFSAVIGGGAARTDVPLDLPKGALLGKSLPAAVKLWLISARRKASVREIATALRDGGVESTSPNFENVVSGALHRLKANHEVLRFKEGWAAAELYPSSLRSTLSKASKAPRTSRKKPLPRSDGNTSELILGLLPTSPIDALAPNDVVASLKRIGHQCSPDYVRIALRRLRERGKVEKHGAKYIKKAA